MFEPIQADYVPYAGIGARDTPADILSLMRDIGTELDVRGYVLRSGGAEGADEAFERGTSVMTHMEIFLPWSGFNGKIMHIKPTPGQWNQAMEIARRFHPNWEACSDGVRKLLARNTFQILGRNLDSPSKFVICWTKNGGPLGGTGQALRVAEGYDVPILNLQREADRVKIYSEFGWS